MEKKRILILYTSFGSGHKTAAQAIEEAFNLKYPEIEIKKADVLDFAFEVFRKSLLWLWLNMKTPLFYKWMYEYYNHKPRLKSLIKASRLILKKSPFVDFVNDFSPHFIISTNPLPAQLISEAKEKKIIDIPSANVCTDFGFHSFWYNPDVNLYFVATTEMKKALTEHGASLDKVKITGIPVSLKFSKMVNRKDIISGLGFDESKPVLLVVGGNTKPKFLSFIENFKKKNTGVQLIIVAGRDKSLYDNLLNSDLFKDPSVKVFSFINNLDEYMSSADLILTKAGGLTVAECLAKNLPMAIANIIPGQEEDNANYVEKNGAGVRLDLSSDAVKELGRLFLGNNIEEMRKNCKRIAQPQASLVLVDSVIQTIKNHG